MQQNTEYIESIPNVKTVRDGQGRLWLCEASVNESGDPRGQGCVLSDEIMYDRNFGG